MSKDFFEDSYALQDLDENNAMNEVKNIDRGFNQITRRVMRHDGKIKNKNISVYTSNGIGFKIRDAESGQYYNHLVGSKDEDLFFKVSLSTGELKSSNGSNTLFYVSPQHYMNHLYCELPQETITLWEQKYKNRMEESKLEKKTGAVKVN